MDFFMKKAGLLIILGGLLVSCAQDVGPDVTDLVVGAYQLVDYQSPTVVDLIPNGTLNASQQDNQHVLITINGTVGKTKIAYSLANVLVVSVDRTTTNLTIKGKPLGQVVDNGVSRYISLTPAAKVTLGAMMF
ncbi:hypothetical protein [Spirosoma foliorum]|uniref:Lipocalin-like domain-containing protein n=1 Tax=Spirosoma foliorum TaxID=2710596 RepID=A0A7G5GR78_9BACT|nr:hypothetical protein [Spirosoma foliorum]QMW01370.1 hypothetical protein H3H32_25910 [Spirosoma foliorum]